MLPFESKPDDSGSSGRSMEASRDEAPAPTSS